MLCFLYVYADQGLVAAIKSDLYNHSFCSSKLLEPLGQLEWDLSYEYGQCCCSISSSCLYDLDQTRVRCTSYLRHIISCLVACRMHMRQEVYT